MWVVGGVLKLKIISSLYLAYGAHNIPFSKTSDVVESLRCIHLLNDVIVIPEAMWHQRPCVDNNVRKVLPRPWTIDTVENVAASDVGYRIVREDKLTVRTVTGKAVCGDSITGGILTVIC